MMPRFPPLPLKFRTAGFPQYGFKRYFFPLPSCFQFALSISPLLPFSSVLQLFVWQMFPHGELSSRAPLLHLHYRDFSATTGSSASPIRLLIFAFSLYPQPLLNRTFPTFPDWTFMARLDPYPDWSLYCLCQFLREALQSPPRYKGWHHSSPANDYPQGVHFGTAVFALC